MKKVLEAMARAQKENLAFNIVALGDSVTNGVFDCRFDMEAAWHNQLKKLLNGVFSQLRINMINSGINGDSAQGALARLDSDVFAYRPDLVIVCLGLNNMDTASEEMTRLMSGMFARIAEKGIPAIYLAPNMVDTYADEKEINRLFGETWAVDYAKKLAEKQTNGEVDALFAAAKAAARENGAVVCDAYAAWKNLYDAGADTTMLLSNRINHPTREMHQVFAALLLNTLLLGE